MAISSSRDYAEARFAVLTGVIVSLIAQILLTLIFTGIAGLFPPVTVAPNTFNWVVFGTWAFAGIIAAALGGMAVGWAANRQSEWDVGLLAFGSWSIAILLVTFFGAIAANAGSGLMQTFVSPAYGYFTVEAATAAARRTAAVAALASAIALLIGAAAAIVGSQIATAAPGTNRSSRRARA